MTSNAPHGHRTCCECGTVYAPGRAHESFFCSSDCRQAWNNRRAKRGAELYDLFMALRYERGLSQVLGLWSLICRMAQAWRDEDVAKRDGRKSWGDAKTVCERNVRYRATVVHRPR